MLKVHDKVTHHVTLSSFLWLLEHIFKRENVESIYDYRGSKTYKILKVGRQQVCEDRAKSSSVQQIRASS